MYLVFSLAGRRIRKLIFSFKHCVTFKATVAAGNYYFLHGGIDDRFGPKLS